jgi:hypothetical protein
MTWTGGQLVKNEELLAPATPLEYVFDLLAIGWYVIPF